MTTAVRKDETRPKDVIPDVIVDPSTGKRYLKGRFLGKVRSKGTCPVLLWNEPIRIYAFLAQ